MTTREQQVRNGVIYLLPVIIASLLPILVLPLYTRVLSREEYGAWGLAMVYGMFATSVANFGLTVGFERNFFEQPDGEGRGRLLYSTLAFVVGALALFALATWAFRTSIAVAVAGSAAYAPLFLCTFLAQGIMSIKAYYLIFFRNTGQARAHVWYSVDELVGATVLGLVFVFWFRIGVIGIPLGQLIASLTVLAALTTRFVRHVPIGFSGRLLKGALAISFPMTPRVLLGVVATQLDKYLLGIIATLGGVGVYTIGQRVAYVVFSYMTALENVFTPQVYDRMFKLGSAGGAAVGTYLSPFAYLSTVVALGIGLFAEEAITVLTTPEFHGAIPIAAILSLHYGVMFFGKLPQLVYAKKTGIVSVLTLVSIALNAAFNVVFIRRWGANGAALGTLAAGMTSLALALVVGQRYYPIRWQYGTLAWIFGLLFTAVIGALWMRESGFTYAARLAFKAAALGVYVLAGVWLGILSRDNLAMARTALARRAAATT